MTNVRRATTKVKLKLTPVRGHVTAGRSRPSHRPVDNGILAVPISPAKLKSSDAEMQDFIRNYKDNLIAKRK